MKMWLKIACIVHLSYFVFAGVGNGAEPDSPKTGCFGCSFISSWKGSGKKPESTKYLTAATSQARSHHDGPRRILPPVIIRDSNAAEEDRSEKREQKSAPPSIDNPTRDEDVTTADASSERSGVIAFDEVPGDYVPFLVGLGLIENGEYKQLCVGSLVKLTGVLAGSIVVTTGQCAKMIRDVPLAYAVFQSGRTRVIRRAEPSSSYNGKEAAQGFRDYNIGLILLTRPIRSIAISFPKEVCDLLMEKSRFGSQDEFGAISARDEHIYALTADWVPDHSGTDCSSNAHLPRLCYTAQEQGVAIVHSAVCFPRQDGPLEFLNYKGLCVQYQQSPQGVSPGAPVFVQSGGVVRLVGVYSHTQGEQQVYVNLRHYHMLIFKMLHKMATMAKGKNKFENDEGSTSCA